jgi:hypothetical protein
MEINEAWVSFSKSRLHSIEMLLFLNVFTYSVSISAARKNNRQSYLKRLSAFIAGYVFRRKAIIRQLKTNMKRGNLNTTH